MLDRVVLTSPPFRRLVGRRTAEQWHAGFHVASGLHVRAFRSADARLRVSATVNTNRFIHDVNYPLLSCDAYKDAVTQLDGLLLTSTGHSFIVPLLDWHVTEAELARDFADTAPHLTIQALGHSWWPHGAFQLRWIGATKSTLVVEGRSYQVKAYDKAAELRAKKGIRIPSTLRIEATVNADTIRNTVFKDSPTTLRAILEALRPDPFEPLRRIFKRHYPFESFSPPELQDERLGSLRGERRRHLRQLYFDVQTRGVPDLARDAQNLRKLKRDLQCLVDRGLPPSQRPLDW